MGVTTHNSVDDDAVMTVSAGAGAESNGSGSALSTEGDGTRHVVTVAVNSINENADNDCGDLSTRINEMWESANTNNHLLSASHVSALLKKSGLAKHVLRAIWKKAKEGSKTSKGVMNKEEFEAACELVVEGGGTFSLDLHSTNESNQHAVEESNV